MRNSIAPWILGVALVAYVICNVLLTPAAGIETRDPAKVTVVGIAGLVLLFIGLAASIVALVLLIRRSRFGALLAVPAAALYYPAALTELTGTFSSLRPPAGIVLLETVQAFVALIVIGAALWVHRMGAARTPDSGQ